jgi:hypothetical protein
MEGATRLVIKQVRSNGECVGPKGERCAGMQQHGAHTLIESAKNTFDTTVLLQCVRASHAQDHAVSGQKRTKCMVVKVLSVIGLKIGNQTLELGLNKCME